MNHARNVTLQLYGGAVILEFCLIQFLEHLKTNRLTIGAALLKYIPDVCSFIS